MADPDFLEKPSAGGRYDPTAIDATGATLGDVLTAVSDGSGGKRAGYAAPSGGGGAVSSVFGRTGAVVAAANDYTIAQIAGLASVAANAILAGPTSGGSAAAAMRALVAADIPSLDAAKITSGVFPIARLATGTPDGTKFVRDDGTLATPSGGGGGTTLYTKWDSDVPDGSPHSITKEFSSSDLSAWTVVNSRGTIDADTTAKGKLFMSLPSQLYRYVAYLQALPGDTNWTIHTKVWVAAKPSGSVLAVAGFVISDTNTTNTGKQSAIAFGHSEDGPAYRQTVTWDGFGETASGAGAATFRTTSHHCYIRIRKNSGTYYCAWSGDGETWWETTFTIYGGITPAYIGLYAQNYTAYDASFSFEYFRYYANGTQYKTGAAVNVLG